ncbi:MAG: condensation domain-containing protein, partial [Vicinamibacteria bacterium]
MTFDSGSKMVNLASLLDELSRRGIRISAEGDRLMTRAPRGTLTDELRQELSDHKPELLRLLRSRLSSSMEASSANAVNGHIERLPRDRDLRLSFAQERLWFLHQLHPEDTAYNIQIAVRIRGSLRVDLLERSVQDLVRRHEPLRTTFAAGPEGPVQRIHAAGNVCLEVT